MSYIPDSWAAHFRGDLNLGIYIKIGLAAADGPLRLWAGVNNVPQHIHNIEIADEEYVGCGRLLNIPDFDVLINGGAERMEFSLEGVSDDAMAKIAMVPANVTGRAVRVGMAPLDNDWQPKTKIIALTFGEADFWSMRQDVAVGANRSTKILSLSAGFGHTGRTRPRRVTYTDAQQRRFFDDDTYCKNVPRYDRGFTLSWPRF